MAVVFIAKVVDNMLGTARTILVQRNMGVFAGIALAASNFISYYVTKIIVTSDGFATMVIASVASGVGCYLAIRISNKLSKDRTYVDVIMSDNKEAMMELRDFLAEHHVTNVATDSYTRDWSRKTITITAYPETKDKSKLIDHYIAESPLKFKRITKE